MASIILYIDPASTSALLYIIIALVATVAFSLRGYFYRLKNLILGRGFVAGEELSGTDIVFYSEGRQYWSVFLPIIRALEKKGVPCAYLTSDKEDPGLNYKSDFYKSKYIGNLTMTSVYLNKLKTKFVGMTTPQLDVMMIQRSKKVQHYGHIVHAPIDVFTYRKFAFDYFDSVFCSGPHQIEGIQKLEEKRGAQKKMLLETGLTYYDVMLNDLNSLPKSEKKNPIVLVAPTWKEYSIINRFGVAFFTSLLNNTTFDVILRPHPQSFVSFPKLMDELRKYAENNPRLTIDTNPTGVDSMEKSDIMISDLSGVIWDYAFLFSKPVLLLKTEFETIEGFEGSELNYQMWEMRERDRLGRIFDENDIERIGSIVNELLDDPPLMQLEELRDESLFNFGNAGEVAANQILQIVNGLDD
ncbi:MAG: CDP-glycerol glycerophosphotransferase family protein [Bacteroidales bacterium]|nr:CDP-glycerol glycerophosphotransferase family protein [Bacteroidales bacterium]MDD4385588.1 CDP-glycerol glycerophosphotransferase family protein [Bacteroidales bacterium]MDY0198806.1 CDP-glycerol glycerophosphotransferase family protein [Tenuifilaceae bacterium]